MLRCSRDLMRFEEIFIEDNLFAFSTITLTGLQLVQVTGLPSVSIVRVMLRS